MLLHKFPSFALMLLALLCICGCTALHILPSKKVQAIRFEQTSDPALRFVFSDPISDTALIQLRSVYPLTELVKDAKSEHEKVLLALHWVRSRWEHSGSHDAKTNNACTILQRAEKGERFRCVEYGIVLKEVLNAVGLPARTLGLCTRDVEKTWVGAGHVLTEVWLKDHKKWALVDAQFDAMPMLDGVPLHAVELQEAIIHRKAFKFVHLGGDLTAKETKKYMDFIPHYLYYFDVSFDNRVVAASEKLTINGQSGLMLVPVKAKNPTVFQRKFPMGDYIYTNSIADFYPVLP
jgi:hypothetical protein